MAQSVKSVVTWGYSYSCLSVHLHRNLNCQHQQVTNSRIQSQPTQTPDSAVNAGKKARLLMSAWLAEACIRRSQEILFLTFVLLHSLAVSPLRSSPFSSHKLNQSRGNRGKARRGKSLQTRSPLRRDSQQLETNAASVRQYSDRLADRLAD